MIDGHRRWLNFKLLFTKQQKWNSGLPRENKIIVKFNQQGITNKTE